MLRDGASRLLSMRGCGLPRPMQRAELVAVGIAEIGEVELAEAGLAQAGGLLDRSAAVRASGFMPGLRVRGAVDDKADRAAIGVRRGLAVDRLRHHEGRAFMRVDQPALLVLPAGLRADRGKQRVVELLRALNVIAADHDVAEHSLGALPVCCPS
jgi:hypothetical protein